MQRHSPAGAAFLSLPIVLGVGMFAAGIGLFLAIRYGFEPRGGIVRYTFQSTCTAEARPAMIARLGDFGLPVTPFGAGLDFQVQLPGVDDDELQHLPRALARPGRLEVAVDGVARPVTVTNAGFQLSMTSGMAVTLLTLSEPLPDTGVTVAVDGASVAVESVNGPELQLLTDQADSRLAVREATELAVALRHPIPCPVVLSGATKVETPG